MIELVDVISLDPLDGYRLFIQFSDGSEGVADLSTIIAEGGYMVEPLRDPELFKRAFISFGVPSWPNGFDIDAINLHRQMKEEGRLNRPAA